MEFIVIDSFLFFIFSFFFFFSYFPGIDGLVVLCDFLSS